MDLVLGQRFVRGAGYLHHLGVARREREDTLVYG